jgi:hypothetical protein
MCEHAYDPEWFEVCDGCDGRFCPDDCIDEHECGIESASGE